jgi:hypothetical protein
MNRTLSLATILLLTLGCAGLIPQAVPASHSDFVGHWTGQDTVLDIQATGECHYAYTGGPDIELTMACVDWTPTSFAIGVAPARKAFTIDSPPRKSPKGKGWKMTLDGVELRRSN